MHVAMITKPGTNLIIDKRLLTEATELLRLMTEQVTEANIALNLFASIEGRAPRLDENALERDDLMWQFTQEVEAENREKYSGREDDRPDSEQEKIEVWKRYYQILWDHGVVPPSFATVEKIMHAKSFVYALAIFGNALRRLSRIAGMPQELGGVLAKFTGSFPSLYPLRHSFQHADERVIGLRERKPIIEEPESPVEFWMIRGIMIGDSLGHTADPTKMDIVPITRPALDALSSILHESYSCFQWERPIVLTPQGW